MTPDLLLAQLKRGNVSPAYLFLGTEAYRRDQCRRALVEAALPEEERETGLTRHDLDEVSLAEVIDDACAYSLFAPRRVIWVTSAEAALPRLSKAAAAADEDEESAPKSGGAARIDDFMRNPVPGVVLVFQAGRFELEGEDKARVDRVRKFYSGINAQVEFQPFTPAEARSLAEQLARAAGLRIGDAEVDHLVDALGANAQRLATEIEKFRLFLGEGGTVREEHIAAMVPDAREATIFALVNALGRSDRRQSLEILDTLVREGEYLPLALSFLGTQFRLALMAREAGLRGAQQIQMHFQKLGVQMWRSRAEAVAQTAAAFPRQRLETALQKIFAADRALRDTRPDDRVVMEQFILGLTA